MVNLVIVSHSHSLAKGIKELADQMTHVHHELDRDVGMQEPTADKEAKENHFSIDDSFVKIAAIGGIVDPDHAEVRYQLGTDALRIEAAVNEIWTPEGVLLLVDLGSSVLSAELALDMLPEEKRNRCLISNAPLVEGTIAAVMAASFGQDLDAVNHAAESACNLDKVARL